MVRLLGAALVTVLVTVVSAGCTDKSEAPSAKEFCAAYAEYVSTLSSTTTGTEADFMDRLKKAARALEDTGMPDDAPPDARAGLANQLDAIEELPDDASLSDLAAIGRSFSPEEREQSVAFNSYLGKTCPGVGGSLL